MRYRAWHSKQSVPGQSRHAAPFFRMLPRCKSFARGFAKAEDRGAAPCAIAHIHAVRSRNRTAAGAATPRGSANFIGAAAAL